MLFAWKPRASRHLRGLHLENEDDLTDAVKILLRAANKIHHMMKCRWP